MSIIKYPLSTEKAIKMMESENKLVFVVERKATKQQIREELKQRFSVDVVSVNTINTVRGKKHAYVRFNDESPAIDVATKLGMM